MKKVGTRRKDKGGAVIRTTNMQKKTKRVKLGTASKIYSGDDRTQKTNAKHSIGPI